MDLKKYNETKSKPKVSIHQDTAGYKYSRRKWHIPSLSALWAVIKPWVAYGIKGIKIVAAIGFLVILNGWFKSYTPSINYDELYTVVPHKTVCQKSELDTLSCEAALDVAERYHHAAVWQIDDKKACEKLHGRCEPSTRSHSRKWQPSPIGYAVFNDEDKLSALPLYQNTVISNATFPNGAPAFFFNGKVKTPEDSLASLRVYKSLADHVCPDGRRNARTPRMEYAKRIINIFQRQGEARINIKDWDTC